MSNILDEIRAMKAKMDAIGPKPITDLVVTPAHEQALRRHMDEMRLTGDVREDVTATKTQFDGVELHVAHNEYEAIEIMQRMHRDKTRRWAIVSDGMLQVAANKIQFFDFPDVGMKVYHQPKTARITGITP